MSKPRARHCEGSKQFALFPIEWLTRISKPTDLRVFLVLCAHANRDTGRCDPGKARIAKLTGVDARHVARSLRNLEVIGALKTRLRNDDTSEYTVLPPAESWINENPDAPWRCNTISDLKELASRLKARGVTFTFHAQFEPGQRKAIPRAQCPGTTSDERKDLTLFLEMVPWNVFREVIEKAPVGA